VVDDAVAWAQERPTVGEQDGGGRLQEEERGFGRRVLELGNVVGIVAPNAYNLERPLCQYMEEREGWWGCWNV
jgi:hypothetical protein